MKILMVNTYHYPRGGDCVYALDVSARLRQMGHGVLPFAMRHPDNLWAGTEENFPPELDYPSLMEGGGLRDRWTVLRSSIYNSVARSHLSKLLDRERVDVAHLHSVMHHLTASVVLELRARGIPIVWTLHDFKAVCPTTRLLREGRICEECGGGRFHRALFRRCKRGSLGASAIVTAEMFLQRRWRIYEDTDLLIAPSRFLAEKVQELGLAPGRIESMYNPVDLERFTTSDSDDGYVLYAGRLSPEKGVATLIEASAMAGGIPLRIAGGGELEESLKDLCREKSWTHVRFEGHVGGEGLSRLYRGARFVAVPSEWYENCPLVVLEAMACGKPVLASRIGGLPELVGHGVEGLLIEPGDLGSWSKSLAQTFADVALCRRMGLRARSRVEERHDPKLHIARLLGFYEALSSSNSLN